MVNQQVLQGNWNDIKGKIRERWGQLTGDELQSFNGNVDQLVGMIQRRTGEARGEIEEYLQELTASGSAGLAKASENVRAYATQASESMRQYADQASESFQQGYDQATEAMREGYMRTEEMVRQHPLESVAVCFGCGVLTGVVLGLMLRSR